MKKKLLSGLLAACVMFGGSLPTALTGAAAEEEEAPVQLGKIKLPTDLSELMQPADLGNQWGIALYKNFEGYETMDLGIPYSSIGGSAFTFTIPEKTSDGKDNRANFDGSFGGEVILDFEGGDLGTEGDELYEKYHWITQGWYGFDDAELEIDTVDKEKPVQVEKITDYTYNVSFNEFDNPLANGDADEITFIQSYLHIYSEKEIEIEVLDYDVLDTYGNILARFDGSGYWVELPEKGIVQPSDPSGIFNGNGDKSLFPIKFYSEYDEDLTFPDITLKDVSGVSAIITIPSFKVGDKDNRDFFWGRLGGSLTLGYNYGDLPESAEENPYNWLSKYWWGFDDPALGISSQTSDDDTNTVLTEKIDEYTYKLTASGFKNPFKDGLKADWAQVAFQLWGPDPVAVELVQLDILNDNGKTLVSFDGNANVIKDEDNNDEDTDDEDIDDENDDDPSIVKKPSSLKSTSRTNSSITLSWSKVSGANGYVLQQSVNGKWKTVQTINKRSTTTAKISKLKAGTQYKFRVRAFKTNGKKKNYSDYATTTAATNPSKIKNLKISKKDASSITLSWDKNNSAAGYQVQRKAGSKWKTVKNIKNNSTTSLEIGKLKKGTSYKFRVTAYTKVGGTTYYSAKALITGKTKRK